MSQKQENNPMFNSLDSSAAPDAAEPVKDISTQQFEAEVLNASQERPVLVDFWAPWCEPCKQLAPILERAVKAAQGKVKLVKMNIDEHPEIPGQMGIRSIPAVVAFAQGRPADAFTGVQPEAEIARFIEKLIGPQGPSPVEQSLEKAETLAEQGAMTEAANLYAAILQAEPNNLPALCGMGMLYLKSGDVQRARATLDAIPKASAQEQKFLSLKASVELAEQAAQLGGVGELNARIEANPKDWEARFDLALALNAAGKREEAADHLLEITQKDRNWREDGAREQLLVFFEAWGAEDPATIGARRRLSSILFS